MLVSTMRERFEELKNARNILLNYDEILLFYPDYFKTKITLENESFLSKEAVDKKFEENYKNAPLYSKLCKLVMAEEEIKQIMKQRKDNKYKALERIFVELVQSSITLCKLIDYIGHYPTTFPAPKEEEKDPEMEELLQKYDIMIRYHLDDDIDEMQIVADDVVRIIEKLEENLDLIQQIKERTNDEDCFVSLELAVEKRNERTKTILDSIEGFPLSEYQKRQKSRREEGIYYLRLQHGDVINDSNT